LLPEAFMAVLEARPAGADPRQIVIRPASSGWTGLLNHLRDLTDHKDLLQTLSAHRISVRYRQTALGVLWAVLQPLLMMLIFTGVFSILVRMPSDGLPYALFAYTALLPWNFFATALTNGTSSLVGHTQLITRVYFPREILPLTYVIAAAFDFAIGCIVLIALMAWYDVVITAHVWLLIPIVLVLVGWAFALAMIFSAAQVRWRDVGMAVPLLVQLWMFASPVIYPLSAVPVAWRSWYLLNPMAGIISSFRNVLLHGELGSPVPLTYSVVITAIVLAGSYLVFKRAEATMADVV
jgi:homopolymeric O-antigen transport system permease protein